MRDWKKETMKLGGIANCKDCGKPLKDPKFDFCWECNEKRKSGTNTGVEKQSGLLNDYLQGGYFDQKGHLHTRYIVRGGDADTIAKKLGIEKPAMTNHQLRRFYSHVRAAENKLKITQNFSSALVDLRKLDAFVAEAKGKGKIPDIFYGFINKNLENVKTQDDFLNGFMEHFQAVVGFFTYHYPKK